MPDLALIATVAIFIATYAVVAVGKVPVYRISHRSRRRGVAWRQPHARHRRLDAAGGLSRHRFRHHHALARHDDRGGQPARFRLLRPGYRVDRDACPPSVRVAVAIVLASGTLSAFLVNDTFRVGAPLRVMTGGAAAGAAFAYQQAQRAARQAERAAQQANAPSGAGSAEMKEQSAPPAPAAKPNPGPGVPQQIYLAEAKARIGAALGAEIGF